MRKNNSMSIRFGRLLLIMLSTTSLAAEPDLKLNPAQTKAADNITLQYKASCLRGADLSKVNDEFTKQLLRWGQEPEVCACNANRLRSALTPEALSNKPDALEDFMVRWSLTDMAYCTVPHMKMRFASNCLTLFSKAFGGVGPGSQFHEKAVAKGLGSGEQVINDMCRCVNSAMANVNTESWVQLAAANYLDYKAAKDAGQIYRPKPDPITTQLETCMAASFSPKKP